MNTKACLRGRGTCHPTKLQRRSFSIYLVFAFGMGTEFEFPKMRSIGVFTAGMGGFNGPVFGTSPFVRLVPYILAIGGATLDILMAMGSGSVCSSTSRHCSKAPF